MSAGDVVCTGWLIKSPPEKKLKRFAWRKRWFVLRRGRMSGNPDVLEYYQSKNSKKPIRTIDLKECEVEMLDGQIRIKRDFHGKHLFVVKTSSRTFYLVAKTEEEMNGWINSISQICYFGTLEDAESSEDGFPHTPTSLQPSPDGSDAVSMVSQMDGSYPPDYLFLSQCETGSVSISRQESFNSDYSLEQRSSEDTHRDIVPSPLYADSFSSSSFPSPSPCVFSHCRLSNPPFSAPCPMILPCSSSSPLRRHCATSVFQFDTVFDASSERLTPPPLPPKPGNVLEQTPEKVIHQPQALSMHQLPSHSLFSRRTSMSGLDQFRPGNHESRMLRDRRQSLNLPLNTSRAQACQEESYVHMSTPPVVLSNTDCEGYIPMSPRACGDTESPLSSLMSQLGEFAPPPINRHLKPRLRRARPPPLDLRGLSTITECPTNLTLNKTTTDLCFVGSENNIQTEDTGCIINESRHICIHGIDGVVLPMSRKSNLDYLSLDFNSASPSPVQKKQFLSDEHRVDYVQVDEKKTQALQNTKMEWTDTRQSKT